MKNDPAFTYEETVQVYYLFSLCMVQVVKDPTCLIVFSNIPIPTISQTAISALQSVLQEDFKATEIEVQ